MQHSKKFRRWMGSYVLVTLTLLADLIGAYASFLLGQYVFPLYGIVLGYVLGFLGGVVSFIGGVFSYIGGSIHTVGGATFLLFLIAGALLGLLLGTIVATRDRYGNVEFLQGLVAFLSTVVIALLGCLVYGLFTYGHPLYSEFKYPPAHLAPNTISGWVCLAGYVLAHLICYAIQNTPNEHLSRADPKGPMQAHLDRCYQRYNTALPRFNPRPIARFDTPVDLCFHEGESKEITWDGRTLVVPKQLLHPENEAVLRPELARQIMYFNGPDLSIQHFLNSYPHSIGIGIIVLLTGNFILLPALVQTVAGARWRGERVLDADRYAFLLGEGVLLRQVLQLEQEELRAQGLKDLDFPTLSERIDQLDALIKDEQQQMQQLGIPVQPAKST